MSREPTSERPGSGPVKSDPSRESSTLAQFFLISWKIPSLGGVARSAGVGKKGSQNRLKSPKGGQIVSLHRTFSSIRVPPRGSGSPEPQCFRLFSFLQSSGFSSFTQIGGLESLLSRVSEKL